MGAPSRGVNYEQALVLHGAFRKRSYGKSKLTRIFGNGMEEGRAKKGKGKSKGKRGKARVRESSIQDLILTYLWVLLLSWRIPLHQKIQGGEGGVQKAALPFARKQ